MILCGVTKECQKLSKAEQSWAAAVWHQASVPHQWTSAEVKTYACTMWPFTFAANWSCVLSGWFTIARCHVYCVSYPAGHSLVADRTYWGPSVVPGPLPTKAFFSTAPVAALASLNDLAGNFGHALFDFLFPVYNMLSILGKSDAYSVVIWPAKNQDSILALYSALTVKFARVTTLVFLLCRSLPSKLSTSLSKPSGTCFMDTCLAMPNCNRTAHICLQNSACVFAWI